MTDQPEPMFGADDCTCIPWTRQTNPPRYMKPTDTVDMISGWERGQDCPHHAPVVQPAAREAALREAADIVDAMRAETFVNVAVYPAWDGREKAALGTAASRLRRMADKARQSEEAWPSESQWRVEMFDPGAEQWVPGGSPTTKPEAERRMALAAQRTPQWADDGTEVRRRIVRTTVTYTVEPEEAGR